MANKIRISGRNKEILPTCVAAKIKQIGDEFGIRSFTYNTAGDLEIFFVNEGSHYWGIRKDGAEASFQVVSENSIGGSGMSHAINGSFRMPAGSFLIEIYYYTRFFMAVYKIEYGFRKERNMA